MNSSARRRAPKRCSRAQSFPPASALLVVVDDEHDGQFLSVHAPVAWTAARQSSVSDVLAHAPKDEEFIAVGLGGGIPLRADIGDMDSTPLPLLEHAATPTTTPHTRDPEVGLLLIGERPLSRSPRPQRELQQLPAGCARASRCARAPDSSPSVCGTRRIRLKSTTPETSGGPRTGITSFGSSSRPET